jgi:hypothetical protein
MPDDVEVEESQEQVPEIDEGELAFGEAAEEKEAPDLTKADEPSKKGEKQEKPDKKAEPEKGADKDKKPEKETEPDKKPDKEKELDTEKEPEKKTARKRLEDRLKDDSEKKPDTEKEPEPEKTPEKKAEPDTKTKEAAAKAPAKQLRLTKENIKNYLEFFGDDALPDKEVVIGDRTINFKELKEDEPELYDAMKVMSGFAIDKALRHMVSTGAIVTGEQVKAVQKEISDLRNEVDDSRFWSEVARTHADVHQILLSTNKQFAEWRDKQPKSIQKLAKNLDTPQDAIDIIDAYKEDLAKEKTKEHDSNLERKKKETDDLHKHTMKSSQTRKPSTDKTEDEGKVAFKEEASKKDD